MARSVPIRNRFPFHLCGKQLITLCYQLFALLKLVHLLSFYSLEAVSVMEEYHALILLLFRDQLEL